MKISTQTTRQLAQAIALAVVVAGLAVPAAAAASRQAPDTSHPYGAGLAPAALPAGEPKHELPFTRSASERSPAQMVATTRASQAASIQGEPKNQQPFRRAATGSAAASGLSQGAVGAGEQKNQAPFTRSVTAQPQTTFAHSSSGFRWGDAAIGAAAAIGLALLLASAAIFARTSRTHESSPAL